MSEEGASNTQRHVVREVEQQLAHKIEELKQQSYEKLAWLLEYQKHLDISIDAHVSIYLPFIVNSLINPFFVIKQPIGTQNNHPSHIRYARM